MLLGAIGFLLAIGTYDVNAYLWLEGLFVLGTFVLIFLFFSRSARPLLVRTRPAAPAAQGGTTDACLLRRRPPLPRARPPARGRVRVHDRHPGGADPLDLGCGEGRRDRARPTDLLRDGPALLPRPARSVHAERDRGARGVLRQLPRQRRRPRRPGLRLRLPVLPRDDRPGAAGCRRSCSGRASAAARGRGSSMADQGARVACVVVTYDALPWIERCLASVAGTDVVVVDNGSSDGTVDLVRERFPGRPRDRGGEPGPGRRVEPGHRRDARRPRARPERRRLARRGRPRAPARRGRAPSARRRDRAAAR